MSRLRLSMNTKESLTAIFFFFEPQSQVIPNALDIN